MKIYSIIHRASRYVSRLEQYERFRKGIKKNLSILSSTTNYVIDNQDVNNIIKYYKENLGIKPTLYWHQFYSSVNGIFAVEYVPTDLYYGYIQPRLFDMTVCAAYDDKNMYDRFFPSTLMPETIVKCSKGHYYNSDNILIDRDKAEEICKNLPEAIMKPAYQSAGGEGVIKICVENGQVKNKKVSIHDLFDTYKGNFIIQKVLKQHDSLKN